MLNNGLFGGLLEELLGQCYFTCFWGSRLRFGAKALGFGVLRLGCEGKKADVWLQCQEGSSWQLYLAVAVVVEIMRMIMLIIIIIIMMIVVANAGLS